MPTRFHWLTFDVSGLLPPHWQQEIIAVGAAADFRDFPRTPGLTREASAVRSISRGRVHAGQVRLQLPWLYELYHGHFLDLINGASDESVMTAADDRYGVVLNVQRGPSMRFECHVDSNPLSGLLFCTDHRQAANWCVAHDPDCGRPGVHRARLLGHPAARRAPDLLRRTRPPALRPPADRSQTCASSPS